jgi:hypothetical protein
MIQVNSMMRFQPASRPDKNDGALVESYGTKVVMREPISTLPIPVEPIPHIRPDKKQNMGTSGSYAPADKTAEFAIHDAASPAVPTKSALQRCLEAMEELGNRERAAGKLQGFNHEQRKVILQERTGNL